MRYRGRRNTGTTFAIAAMAVTISEGAIASAAAHRTTFSCEDDAEARFIVDILGNRTAADVSNACWNSDLREMFECWNVFETGAVGVPIGGHTLSDVTSRIPGVEAGANAFQAAVPEFLDGIRISKLRTTNLVRDLSFMHAWERERCVRESRESPRDRRPCLPSAAFSPPHAESRSTLYVLGTDVDERVKDLVGIVSRERFRVGEADPSPCAVWTGTHVAAIAAGRNHGVSRATRVVPVVVDPGCDRRETVRRAARGVQWVLDRRRAGADGPAHAVVLATVAIDVGDDRARVAVGAFEDVLRALASTPNVTVVAAAAAGPAGDACTSTPSRMPEVVTVGALRHEGAFSTARATGPTGCVDVWAPGHAVESAFPPGFDTASLVSGTPQAAAFVAGAAALRATVSRAVRSEGGILDDPEWTRPMRAPAVSDAVSGAVANAASDAAQTLRVIQIPSAL